MMRLSRLALCLLLLSLLAPMLQIHAQEPPPFLLHEVKSIYVEPMPNGFDSALVQKLLKWGGIKVVKTREEADAALIGSIDVRTAGVVGGGTVGGITQPRFVVTKTVAEVTLVDRKTGRAIWSAKKGSNKGSLKVAQKLVNKLRKDWNESANKEAHPRQEG